MRRGEYPTSHNAKLCEIIGLTPCSPPGGSGWRGTNSASSICPPHSRKEGGLGPHPPALRLVHSHKKSRSASQPPLRPAARRPRTPAQKPRQQSCHGSGLPGCGQRPQDSASCTRKPIPVAAPYSPPGYRQRKRHSHVATAANPLLSRIATRGRRRGLLARAVYRPGNHFESGYRNTGTPPRNRPARTPLVQSFTKIRLARQSSACLTLFGVPKNDSGAWPPIHPQGKPRWRGARKREKRVRVADSPEFD